MHAWALITSVGAAHAPFYLVVVGCGLYQMFNLPLRSSFLPGNGRQGEKEAVIQVSRPSHIHASRYSSPFVVFHSPSLVHPHLTSFNSSCPSQAVWFPITCSYILSAGVLTHSPKHGGPINATAPPDK